MKTKKFIGCEIFHEKDYSIFNETGDISLDANSIVKKILAWSPQKIAPLIYELLIRYHFHHWIDWLYSAICLNDIFGSVINDPEFEDSLCEFKIQLTMLRETYYRCCIKRAKG